MNKKQPYIEFFLYLFNSKGGLADSDNLLDGFLWSTMKDLIKKEV